MRRLFWVLCAMLIVQAGAFTQEGAGATSAAVSAATQKKLEQLLPASAALGARPLAKPVFYGANLYEYIDGGAEAYHLYGFVALIHQQYRAKDTDIAVDIYDMGQPLNAFGIYASERAPDYHYIPVGAEGYVSESTLNFLQGAYYIKLSTSDPQAKAAPTLQAFARSVSGRIQTGKTMPKMFSLFPTANRVARSEKFIRQAPLGHDFLAPAYQATYKLSGKESTLLLSQAANARDARDRVKRLESHFRSAGKVTPAAGLGPGAFKGSTSFEGEMLVAPRGNYAAVLVNPGPSGEAFLKAILARLPETK